MMKQYLLFLVVFLILPMIIAEQINTPTQQSNKIYLNPFYLQSTTANTNYTYTLSVNPPDGISYVSSALISFQVYFTPTVNFNLWVNDKVCNNPTFQISTTYSGAAQGIIMFDCSNVINASGTYTLKFKADKNTGALNGWADVTYTNSPKGALTIHGTEYSYGQNGKVWLQLLNSTGLAVNNGVCYTDIYNPSGGSFLSGATMTNQNSNGIYYYDFSVPRIQGVYPVVATCYYTAAQDKRVALSYTLTTGTATGDITGTQVLDLVYLTLRTAGGGGNNRVNATFNFSGYYAQCSNVSEELMTGMTFYWNGVWNTGTVNHDITLYTYNYTSSSWVTFTNKILGGNGGSTLTVSNSITTTNITKALGITASKQLLIRTADNTNADGPKDFKIDYLYASCDQLTSPVWQQVKGSSELHVTSDLVYSIDNNNLVYNITNNTVNTILYNGTVRSNIYYTGIFTQQFTLQSGVTDNQSVYVEYQGWHSLPGNSFLDLYFVNSTGYYPVPFNTQAQTTEGHYSMNFYVNMSPNENYLFESHARNVWESEARSINTGINSIHPLLNSGCLLWQISHGYPAYITPKNQTNLQYDYYYRACANYYDDLYWFNQTYNKQLADKALIVDRVTYLQYEDDYFSMKFAEDKLLIVTNLLVNGINIVGTYSKLLMDAPLGTMVNITDQQVWAQYSTEYENWKLINASCGTGNCSINVSKMWDYSNRTLTSFNFTVNTTTSVNNTAVADAVWNYGNKSLNYTDNIAFAVWNFDKTISQNILTQIATAIWNYVARYVHGTII